MDLCWQVMSLLFNMLSRLVITFLPRSASFNFITASPSAVILEPKKVKSDTASPVSPSIFYEVMGLDAMILVFRMLSFKPTFSVSSFIFIKRFFSSSSLFAIRVVSSAYLRLLIFLPATLIPACASSSPAFLMMYSACKLNKQGDNIQPCRTPFPIWNQSVGPCPVLTTASWPAYRFLKRWLHVLSKPSLGYFEHCFANVWDEYNYVVVWTFFGIACLWNWNENWPFPVLWLLLTFLNLLTDWVQCFNSIVL